METYLGQSDQQVGSIISSRLRDRKLAQPSAAQHPDDDALPLCAGDFQGRKLTYPRSKSFLNQAGAVITRLETDTSGKVTQVEVLASVPGEVFAGQVASTLKTWTYQAKKSSTGSCRLNSRNHIYIAKFYVTGAGDIRVAQD
jgi:hypothetical protein